MLYIIPMRTIKKISKIYTKKIGRESNKKDQLNRKENKDGGTRDCMMYRKQIPKEAELSLDFKCK